MLVGDNHRVNGERLWDSLMEMALIGPGIKGGNNRQTLTDEDRAGRLLFTKWCKDAGLTMKIDTMGNMFARLDGTENHLPPVVMGSHLDTQPTGGKYDGVLGVLAGLEVIRTIRDLGIKTRHPIEIANWTNEEGARFAPAMVASGVFAGVIEESWAKQQTDSEGKKFGLELERIGFVGDEPCGKHPIKAYYELHIEQGPILEDEAIDIGVVTHGQGLKWIEITLLGKEAHTGSTPMVKRIDAGLGMARILDRVNDIAWRYPPHAVGAVGMANIYPNSRNIIPGKAVFTIDFRHPDKTIIQAMVDALILEGKKIATDLGLEFSWQEVGGFDPVTFDKTCVDKVRSAAKQLGYSYCDIVSGAGHDACWISHVAPSAMIMCPCVDGLSHNEDETITPQWAKSGSDVLLNAVLATAEIID
ncbi:Zn-dependent hydrolase [Bartonella sp. HY038]|uniref:Zn-dependent hydrolase n=1 Tax=Bartonella sp. HY038 TaxID=2759660 RepID=UPI0015F809F2|nr:Zn-dependent hydrolase [Bartonella sp. HY038]